RLLNGDAGLQPREAFDPPGPAILELVRARRDVLRLHRGRHPELERIADKRTVKVFRRDADDRVRQAVDDLRAADHVRIAVEAFLPRPIADDDIGVRVEAEIVSRTKPPAENRTDAERVEVIRRHDAARDAFGAIPDAEVRA